jgi:Arm DNA-binding domain
MPRLALTDRFVAGAKAAADEAQTDYFDDKTPGLALRVSRAGRKAWTFTFTAPDSRKRSRATLGSYPAMTLASARTKATEARGHLHDGADPRSALKRRGAAEITVAELVERYCADPDKAKLRSMHEVRRRLIVNVVPIIGHCPWPGNLKIRLSEYITPKEKAPNFSGGSWLRGTVAYRAERKTLATPPRSREGQRLLAQLTNGIDLRGWCWRRCAGILNQAAKSFLLGPANDL